MLDTRHKTGDTKYETRNTKLTLPIVYCLLSIVLSSCHGDYSPKQKAYPRVIYPDRKYKM